MSIQIKNMWGLFPTAVLGLAATVLTSACGSGESTIATSVAPEAEIVSEANTTLQTTVRPVIYRPGLVLGSLPIDSVTFQGTGFANVNSVTFLGGPLATDDVEADFNVVGDNTLVVDLPGDARTGLIRVSNGFGSAYRFYIAPLPPPPPDPAEIFIASSTACTAPRTQPVDFGNPAAQTSTTRSIIVCNTGDETLEVTSAGFDDADPSGDGVDDYAVTSQPEFEVAPGSFASITVQCTPSEADNNLAAVLEIASNAVLFPAVTEVDLICRGVNS